MKNKVVCSEENICPITKEYCDDECCQPDAECNLSGNNLSREPKPSLEEKALSIEEVCNGVYNQAIQHAISEINELAEHYPGGKTPNGEFFTNPTRAALMYAITLLQSLKKQ